MVSASFWNREWCKQLWYNGSNRWMKKKPRLLKQKGQLIEGRTDVHHRLISFITTRKRNQRHKTMSSSWNEQKCHAAGILLWRHNSLFESWTRLAQCPSLASRFPDCLQACRPFASFKILKWVILVFNFIFYIVNCSYNYSCHSTRLETMTEC